MTISSGPTRTPSFDALRHRRRKALRRATWLAAPLTLLVVSVPVAARADQAIPKVLVIADPTDQSSGAIFLLGALVERLGMSAVARPVELHAPGGGGKDSRNQAMLEDAETARREGRTQYDTLELEAALREYGKALNKLERGIVHTSAVAPMSDTLIMLAATHLLMGQEKKARNLIERAIILDERLRPADAVYNPQMLEVFDAVASEVLGRDVIDVPIDVEPAGALVYFDGRFLGPGPVTARGIRPGRHYLRASAQGHDSLGKAVDVKASGGQLTLKLPKGRTDPKAQSRITAVIEGIEEPRILPGVRDLAGAADADEVLVVARLDNEILLVRLVLGSGERSERAFDGDIDDLRGARIAANALLDWLPPLPAAYLEVAPEPEAPATTTPFAAVPASKPGGSVTTPGGPAKDKPKTETIAAVAADRAGSSSAPEAPATALDSYLFSAHPSKEYALYGLYGATAAFAIAAGVFGGLALGASNDYYLETSSGGRFDQAATTDQIEGADVKSAGQTQALVADILWGLTGAAGLTAALLHIVWDPEVAPGTVPPPSPGPDWGATPTEDEPKGMNEPATPSSHLTPPRSPAVSVQILPMGVRVRF